MLLSDTFRGSSKQSVFVGRNNSLSVRLTDDIKGKVVPVLN